MCNTRYYSVIMSVAKNPSQNRRERIKYEILRMYLRLYINQSQYHDLPVYTRDVTTCIVHCWMATVRQLGAAHIIKYLD